MPLHCRFGVLNKVALLFAERWWGEHDTFGHVADSHEEPGWFYLWYTFPGLSGVHRTLPLCCSLLPVRCCKSARAFVQVLHVHPFGSCTCTSSKSHISQQHWQTRCYSATSMSIPNEALVSTHDFVQNPRKCMCMPADLHEHLW